MFTVLGTLLVDKRRGNAELFPFWHYRRSAVESLATTPLLLSINRCKSGYVCSTRGVVEKSGTTLGTPPDDWRHFQIFGRITRTTSLLHCHVRTRTYWQLRLLTVTRRGRHLFSNCCLLSVFQFTVYIENPSSKIRFSCSFFNLLARILAHSVSVISLSLNPKFK